MKPPPASAARRAAHKSLRQGAARIAEDPQTNSVFALARGLFLEMQAGKRDLDGLGALIDEVHLVLAEQRADAFRAQHDGADAARAWQPVRARLEALAGEGWDAFRGAVETPTGGIVFTAHPTFALPAPARAAFARHVERPSPASRKALAAALSSDPRDWSRSISLTGEHAEAHAALAHARAALSAYAALVFDVAAMVFPENWRTLRPALPTLASWVGYDLDGRTDIHWGQSVALRLSEKAAQLEHYAAQAAAVEGLADLAGRLGAAAALSRTEAAAFDGDLRDPAGLVEAATTLTGARPERITDAAEIVEALDSALETASDDAARAIAVLRAEVEALQLGTARIHLRVNAAQVRAVISRDLGLETEDRDLGRLALQHLSDMAPSRPAGRPASPTCSLNSRRRAARS